MEVLVTKKSMDDVSVTVWCVLRRQDRDTDLLGLWHEPYSHTVQLSETICDAQVNLCMMHHALPTGSIPLPRKVTRPGGYMVCDNANSEICGA